MGKALYLIYGIFTAGVVTMGYSIYSASLKVEDDGFHCLRLSGTAQNECLKSVDRRLTNLGKVAKAIAGEN